jgi:dipeptidyl aminopeptidase/acylaminoacyl peptidase
MATDVLRQPTARVITDPRAITSATRASVAKLSIEKLYMTRQIGASAWSPDATQVCFVSNISGRNNLWLVAIEGEGVTGWPVQLTISDQRQTSPVWSPDGKWIAFISDYDGDEQWDIHLVSPRTGEVINLTDQLDVACEHPAWSPDGCTIAFQRKPKESPTFEIWLADVASRSLRPLTQATPKDLGNYGPLWSRDGKRIGYTQVNAAGKDSNVFVIDIAGGRSELLTPHSGEHLYSAADWSTDDAELLITSNALNGHDNIAVLNIASKRMEWLTEDTWETEAGSFSPDGRLITWTSNVDGHQDVICYERRVRSTEPLLLAPGVNALGGFDTAFTRDSRRLLVYHNGANAPNDVWAYDLERHSARQITSSLVGGLRSDDMVEPALVHYRSRDNRFDISAFVYVPHNIVRDRSHPAIVYVHGGPQAQTVNSFNRIVQYLVNHGYLVIAPNYRGSTGYGKEFMDANRFDMGGGDLQDVLAAAEWITRTGYVDAKKLVIIGGSYGGYMTMMGVTKAPEVWAAGVAIVPFVNWFTEVEHEDPLLREYDLATMGDPVANKSLWEDRSPINFVHQIKAPVLLIAGAHDPRCPVTEAMQVADAVKVRGGIAELKIYDDEGHGFARVPNQIDAYRRVAEFLKLYVPPPREATPEAK